MAPPPGPAYGPSPSNVAATVSLVGGLVGMGSTACVCVPCVGYFALIFMPAGSLVGIISGVIGLKGAASSGVGHGQSIAGIITGVIGLLAFVALLIVYIIYGAAIFAGQFQNMQ